MVRFKVVFYRKWFDGSFIKGRIIDLKVIYLGLEFIVIIWEREIIYFWYLESVILIGLVGKILLKI